MNILVAGTENNISTLPKISACTRGIYFLYHEDVVVYVGISKSGMFGRLNSHMRSEEKIFDSYSFIDFSEDEDDILLSWEAYYIASLRPKYNYIHNRQSVHNQ